MAAHQVGVAAFHGLSVTMASNPLCTEALNFKWREEMGKEMCSIVSAQFQMARGQRLISTFQCRNAWGTQRLERPEARSCSKDTKRQEPGPSEAQMALELARRDWSLAAQMVKCGGLMRDQDGMSRPSSEVALA